MAIHTGFTFNQILHDSAPDFNTKHSGGLLRCWSESCSANWREDSHRLAACFDGFYPHVLHVSVCSVSQRLQRCFEQPQVIMQLLFVLFKRERKQPTQPRRRLLSPLGEILYGRHHKQRTIIKPWEKHSQSYFFPPTTKYRNNVRNQSRSWAKISLRSKKTYFISLVHEMSHLEGGWKVSSVWRLC